MTSHYLYLRQANINKYNNQNHNLSELISDYKQTKSIQNILNSLISL